MKRLNLYFYPCCPLPLKVGCITIAVSNIFIWVAVIKHDVREIYKDGELDKRKQITALPWSAISLIVYLLLFFGTIMKRRRYLVPSLIVIPLEIIHVAYLSVIDFNSDADKPVDERLSDVYKILIVVPLVTVILGMYIYLWIVIWSHFLELGEIDQGSQDKFIEVFQTELLDLLDALEREISHFYFRYLADIDLSLIYRAIRQQLYVNMKRLNSFYFPCGRVTLKTGCIIIAIHNILFYNIFFTGYVREIYKNGGVKKWIEIVELPWFFISLVISLAFLYGVIKKIRKYLVPPLFVIVIEFVHFAYAQITLSDDKTDASDDKKLPEVYTILLVVFFGGLAYGSMVYFWIVIWSHYLELGEIQQGSSDDFDLVDRPNPSTSDNVTNA